MKASVQLYDRQAGPAAKIKVRRNRKGVVGTFMLLLLLRYRIFLYFIRFLRHFCCFFLISATRFYDQPEREKEIPSKVEREGARDK